VNALSGSSGAARLLCGGSTHRALSSNAEAYGLLTHRDDTPRSTRSQRKCSSRRTSSRRGGGDASDRVRQRTSDGHVLDRQALELAANGLRGRSFVVVTDERRRWKDPAPSQNLCNVAARVDPARCRSRWLVGHHDQGRRGQALSGRGTSGHGRDETDRSAPQRRDPVKAGSSSSRWARARPVERALGRCWRTSPRTLRTADQRHNVAIVHGGGPQIRGFSTAWVSRTPSTRACASRARITMGYRHGALAREPAVTAALTRTDSRGRTLPVRTRPMLVASSLGHHGSRGDRRKCRPTSSPSLWAIGVTPS